MSLRPRPDVSAASMPGVTSRLDYVLRVGGAAREGVDERSLLLQIRRAREREQRDEELRLLRQLRQIQEQSNAEDKERVELRALQAQTEDRIHREQKSLKEASIRSYSQQGKADEVNLLLNGSILGRWNLISYDLWKSFKDVPFDVNAGDENGNTALILASANGHAAVVTLLLAAPGIDVNAKNGGNSTAEDEASLSGHADVLTLLRERERERIEREKEKRLSDLLTPRPLPEALRRKR